MIAQLVAFKFRIGEISCPTKYFSEASSINFRRSVTYGFGVLRTSLQFRLWKWGLTKPTIFADTPTSKIDSRNAESRQAQTVVASR
jgi:hypothetical protein